MRTAIALSIAAISAFASVDSTKADDAYYYGNRGRFQTRIQQPVTYRFGAKQHLDTLVVRLHDEANAICWEMYLNHKHEIGFRETYAEMYKILQDLKHIHDLAHDDLDHPGPGHEDHIAHDLHDVDQLFHHIEDDIASWGQQLNHWDHNPYHRHGSRLDLRMERFEETLHHLMRDYGVTSKIGVNVGAPPIPAQGAPLLNNGVPFQGQQQFQRPTQFVVPQNQQLLP